LNRDLYPAKIKTQSSLHSDLAVSLDLIRVRQGFHLAAFCWLAIDEFGEGMMFKMN
jgi:hypothetical protein